MQVWMVVLVRFNPPILFLSLAAFYLVSGKSFGYFLVCCGSLLIYHLLTLMESHVFTARYSREAKYLLSALILNFLLITYHSYWFS